MEIGDTKRVEMPESHLIQKISPTHAISKDPRKQEQYNKNRGDGSNTKPENSDSSVQFYDNGVGNNLDKYI